jgi:hypothetical protein
MRPIPHLIPSVNSVAICAQQSKVSYVSFPVAESVVPNACAALVSQFHSGVNVVVRCLLSVRRFVWGRQFVRARAERRNGVSAPNWARWTARVRSKKRSRIQLGNRF